MADFSRVPNAWGNAPRLAGAASALGLLVVAAAASCSDPSHPPSVETVNPGGDVDASTTAPVDAGREAGQEAHEAGSTSDGTSTCANTQTDAGTIVRMTCAGQCIETNTDNNNCGGCGQICGVTGTTCTSGTCQCTVPQIVCNNQCVDVTKDQSNCGFCGHTCQGNPCTDGLCQASNIAQVKSVTERISSIAVDSTTVYWTEGTGSFAGAYGKPFAGGSPVAFGASADPRGIVVDLTHVYWVDYGTGSVTSAALLGGSPVQLVPGVGDGGTSPGPTAITSDAHNVYWTDSTLGTVNQMPLQGGSIVTLASGRLTPVAIVVDATNVYWADYGAAGNDGSVNKVPIGMPNTITALATTEQQPSGIAVDATNVYWTDRANPSGLVKSVPIAGGTINTIAQGQGAPTGVAVDSQFVYWTNYDDNTVVKAPIAGGMSYTLASGQNNPSAIAVDDKNVYWANQGSGFILKVAK
jgi:hypothetical protein